MASPISAFGSTKPPKPVVYPWIRPLTTPAANLGKSSINALNRAGEEASAAFAAGTPRQESLLGEQENILRTLQKRNLEFDPNSLLKNIGNTAFSFIDPNVVNPLARFDVNSDRIDRMARGLNPAALDSTSQRLRDARIASGRYYDVARNVYGALPSLYGQAFNMGNTNEQLARGYIPEIMSGYRSLELSPLIPAMARADLANAGAGIVGSNAAAAKAATYGFQQPQNIWDKLGKVDESLWGRLGEVVNMAGSLGGMGGGEGGQGAGGGAPAAAPPSYIPNAYAGTPGGTSYYGPSLGVRY
jgi:hypothetical protein